MPKSRPPYPEEFRREAVQLVRSGRTIKDVAESLGVTEQSLRTWVKRDQLERHERDDGLTLAEARGAAKASAREQAPGAGARSAQTSRGLLRTGDRDPVSAYRIISAEKANGIPVSLACELLDVSRSGYYDWSTRAPSDRELTDAWLTEKIRQIHAENRGVYGAPRIHAELRLAHGIQVGRKRVERLMRDAGVSGLVTRKRGRTTVRVPGVRVADDLVERQFRPEEPDVLWIADFS